MNFQYNRIFVALKLAEWKNFKDLQRISGKMCLGCENMCVSVLKAQAIVDLFMLLGVSEVLYVIQIYPPPPLPCSLRHHHLSIYWEFLMVHNEFCISQMNRKIVKLILINIWIYLYPEAKVVHVLLPSLLSLQNLLPPPHPPSIPPQQTLFIQAILPTWLPVHLDTV